jgi:hypothetical protein
MSRSNRFKHALTVYGYAAHCPFVVVNVKDDDILFERERHWVVYPEDAQEAPVETEPSMEIEPGAIPE